MPIIRTVQPAEGHPDDEPFLGDGVAINSANDRISLDGLHVADAKARIIEFLEDEGIGDGHDQLPHPRLALQPPALLGRAVPDHVRRGRGGVCRPRRRAAADPARRAGLQPQDVRPRRRQSSPEPPLSRVPEWVEVEQDLGDGRGLRDVPPRDEHHAQLGRLVLVLPALPRPGQPRRVRRPGQRGVLDGPPRHPGRGRPRRHRDPGGVDLYVGGVEHAVLHLLYARFWHKVLFDLGHVHSEEPFRKYFSQGYIQAYAYTDSRGQYVTASEVEEHPGEHGAEPTFTWQGQPVTREYGKIGKSLKNSVQPRRDVRRVRRRHLPRLRDVDGPARAVASRGRSAPSSAASASCNACGATSSTSRRVRCGSSTRRSTRR